MIPSGKVRYPYSRTVKGEDGRIAAYLITWSLITILLMGLFLIKRKTTRNPP